MKKALLILCTIIIGLSYAAGQQDSSGGADSAAQPPKGKAKVAQQDSVAVDTLVIDTLHVEKIEEGPCLDFGKVTEVDFGKIKEKGGKQVREFTFRNSGNRPLVITKTMVSCKCADVDCPKKPIMPGGEGKITVTYNPRKQSGVFYKAIQVYSNDPQCRHIVFIKGEVIE